MGFVNAEQRRAYDRGYQAGYRQPALADWTKEQRRIRRKNSRSPWLDTLMRGFIAGVSARDGDAIVKRKAAWYQQHRAKIVARQRRQRRARLSAQAIAVIARITTK